jgi:hypothetical protein
MKPTKRQQRAWDELAKTDPHAAEVASLGGTLVRPNLPSPEQFNKEMAKWAPGCGSPSTYWTGQKIPCGSTIEGKLHLCQYCSQTSESMKSARQLIDEAFAHGKPVPGEPKSRMPEEYYDKWDRLHKAERRAASTAKKNPAKSKAAQRASQRLSDHENAFK